MAKIGALGSGLPMLASTLRLPAKKAAPFYQSKEWRALVARRKRDADYGAAVARAKPGERVVLDHVIEISDGGARLDPANTQWLTDSEHRVKTAKAKRARAGLG